MPRVYIGNIGSDCRERDIEDLFKDYGRISEISLKGAYGFINFDDRRDASDAINDIDGKSFNGGRIRVEFAKEDRGGGRRDERRGWGGGRNRNIFGGGQPSMSDWDPSCKVYIGGLRDDANKFDIEDAFSRYGKVRNVWVARKPPGFAFVEMGDSRDAEDAVNGLDGERICGAKVKVEMSSGGRGRGGRRRSRSRSKGRERERSRSGGRYRNRSGGRGRRSPSNSRSWS